MVLWHPFTTKKVRVFCSDTCVVFSVLRSKFVSVFKCYADKKEKKRQLNQFYDLSVVYVVLPLLAFSQVCHMSLY